MKRSNSNNIVPAARPPDNGQPEQPLNKIVGLARFFHTLGVPAFRLAETTEADLVFHGLDHTQAEKIVRQVTGQSAFVRRRRPQPVLDAESEVAGLDVFELTGSPGLCAQPAPPPSRDTREQRQFDARVRRLVREVLAAELPEAVALLVASQKKGGRRRA